MNHRRHARRLVAGALIAALTLVASMPASASASGSDRRGARVDVLRDGLNSPKGLDSFLGQPIVAQGAFGPPGPVLVDIRLPGGRPVTRELSRPISLVDVAVAPDGSLWGLGSDLKLHRKGALQRTFAPVADIAAHQQTDPDPFNVSDDPTESNPYGLAVLPNGDALVADAAGNDLLRITRKGDISTIVRFDSEVVPTDHLGAPGLPPALPAESVPTSIAVVGRSIYVGELKGFPFRPGSSRVWKIDARASGAVCSVDPDRAVGCTSAMSGFTAIQDLDVNPWTGETYVYQLAAGGVLAFEAGFESGQFPPAVLEKVSRRGARSELAAGKLSQPGGVDVGLFGVVHVTDGTFGDGRLLRVR